MQDNSQFISKMEEEPKINELNKKEVKRFFDLTYRNKLAVNSDMTIDMEKNKKKTYSKNIGMTKLDNVNMVCLNYVPSYKEVHWKENYDYCQWTNELKTFPDEFTTLNVNLSDGDEAINYLCPPIKSIYFYDSYDMKYSDEHYEKVNCTYGIEDLNDTNIEINPYQTAPVFGFDPFFKKPDQEIWKTFGILDLFEKASLVHSNILYYLDTIFINKFKNVLKTTIEEQNLKEFESNPFIKYIAFQIGSKVESVRCDLKLFKNFTDKVLDSNVITPYGCSISDKDEKKKNLEAEENDRDEKLYKFTQWDEERALEIKNIYFIDGLVCDEGTLEGIMDMFIKNVLKDLLNSPQLKKLFKTLLVIFLIINEFAIHINMLSMYFNTKDLDIDEMEIDFNDARHYFKKDSYYKKITGLLSSDTFRIKEIIYPNGLRIKRYLDRNLNPEQTYYHKYIQINNKPVSGCLIKAEIKDRYIGNYNSNSLLNDDGYIENNRFKSYINNNINGKSLIFTLDRTRKIRIALLSAHELNYRTSSCRILFDHVFVTYQDKTIEFSPIESENTPYYVCHYIHSQKDSVKEIHSAIRLEFKPEMNLAYEVLDENERVLQQTGINYVLSENIFSTIYYIRADHFGFYTYQYTPINKDEDSHSLTIPIDSCTISYKLTDRNELRITDLEINEGYDQDDVQNYVLNNFPNSNNSIIEDNEFDLRMDNYESCNFENVINIDEEEENVKNKDKKNYSKPKKLIDSKLKDVVIVNDDNVINESEGLVKFSSKDILRSMSNQVRNRKEQLKREALEKKKKEQDQQ